MKTVFVNVFFLLFFWALSKEWQNSVLWQCCSGWLKMLDGERKDHEGGNRRLYRCHLSPSLPAVVQASWGTLASDPRIPPSPVHFPLVSSFVYCPPISWVTEASLETLPPPLSILLPPCRWDTFPDFFPKAEWGRVCYLWLRTSPDKCQRKFCLGAEKISS